MADAIPTIWTSGIPADQTLADLQTALGTGSNWSGMVEEDTWQYTTWTQDIYNWWIAGAWSSGDYVYNRKFSIGTAIHVRFYTYTDIPEHEFRTVIVSRTFVLQQCVGKLTHVEQEQQKVKRTWIRWTLTALFQDDVKGAQTDAVTSAAMSALGIVTEGVANAVLGAAGAIASVIPLFEKAYSILVSKDTADGGEVWVNTGPPSSAIDSTFTLPPNICETLGDTWSKPVTMPVNEVK